MKRGALTLLLILSASALVFHGVVNSQRGAGWRALHAGLTDDAASGSLQGLLRARIGAVRLAASEPVDPAVLAELAFLNASLAHHYELDTAALAAEALGRLQRLPATGAAAPATAAEALLALDRGERGRAAELAERAAAQDPEDIRPLLARTRVYLRLGDLWRANRVAEAAIVKAPTADAPRVEWAEARLDAGQPTAAVQELRLVLSRTPDHPRARLLLAEAEGAEPPAPVCARDAAASPVVGTNCAVVHGMAARLRGDRRAALATTGAAADTHEPRALGRTALLLAQLGEIDRAQAALERAARRGTPTMPALVWARLAVALGRGDSPAPVGLAPGDAETRLLAARTAFVTGGRQALERTLTAMGPAAVTGDPDLRALAGLIGQPPRQAATAPSGPMAAYAAGLRARLAGDLEAAARLLGQALSGHGDACRAAGEYLVALRLLKRQPGAELDPLRAANAGCRNLLLPPPSPDAKSKPRRN
jgi:tetratricopeptide (TPR) repeat protein